MNTTTTTSAKSRHTPERLEAFREALRDAGLGMKTPEAREAFRRTPELELATNPVKNMIQFPIEETV